jgi:hypothetical protein
MFDLYREKLLGADKERQLAQIGRREKTLKKINSSIVFKKENEKRREKFKKKKVY